MSQPTITRTVERIERITYEMDAAAVRHAVAEALADHVLAVVDPANSIITIRADGSATLVTEHERIR